MADKNRCFFTINISIQKFIEYGVEGVIWCPASKNDTFANYRKSISSVVIDRPMADYDNVYSDYAEGGRLLAKEVLLKGHKRIGLISGPKDIVSAQQRREGFLQEIDNKAEIAWESRVPFSVELDLNTTALLEMNNVSTIVAGNDLIAIGALRILKAANIAVPSSVSVTGFDGTPWSDIVSPSLTTIKQPLSKLGQEAVNLLLRRIENPVADKENLILGVHLLRRESLAAFVPTSEREITR